MYIASQIIETVAIIITLASYHFKTKKNIFKGMCLANIFEITHYLFLNAYSGCFTKVVALARNIFIIEKDKNKKLNNKIFLMLFIGIYIILSVLTFNSIYSILPFIAAITYMIVVWNGNELQVKKIAFICYFLWLAYNIFIFSVAGIISSICGIVSTYIAYKNYKKEIKL